jgi:hypothetical protein
VVVSDFAVGSQVGYFSGSKSEVIYVARTFDAVEKRFSRREELEAIQRGIEDIKQGRTFKMRKDESLDDFLNRIEDECNV